jgi:hypothetical protein
MTQPPADFSNRSSQCEGIVGHRLLFAGPQTENGTVFRRQPEVRLAVLRPADSSATILP